MADNRHGCLTRHPQCLTSPHLCSCGGVAVGGAMMPHPHMLHWDAAHPGGQMVPLRQPTLPVYYNTGPGQHMPGSGGSAV